MVEDLYEYCMNHIGENTEQLLDYLKNHINAELCLCEKYFKELDFEEFKKVSPSEIINRRNQSAVITEEIKNGR